MNYLIRKVLLRDINVYLQSLNISKLNFSSPDTSKIESLDHYNWWFENKEIDHFCLQKNKKKVLYFWNKKYFFNKNRYFFSGWWPVGNKFNLSDAIYITKTLIFLSKNFCHVAIISKKNKFSIKLHKYFKFHKEKINSLKYKEIMKIYKKSNIGKMNFIIMTKDN